MLISCSSSSKESLVFRSLDERKRKTYVFKVMKVSESFLKLFAIKREGVGEGEVMYCAIQKQI